MRLGVLAGCLACLWVCVPASSPLHASSLPVAANLSGKALYYAALNHLRHTGRLVYEERVRQLLGGRFVNNRYIVHYIAPDRVDILQELQTPTGHRVSIHLRQIGKLVCSRQGTRWSCRKGGSKPIDIRALIGTRLIDPQLQHLVFSRSSSASSSPWSSMIAVHIKARQDVKPEARPTKIQYRGRTITVHRYNLSAVLMVRASDAAPLSYGSQVIAGGAPLDQRVASFTYGGRFTIADPR